MSERVAVVTGAASGVGQETAKRLLGRGLSVVAVDLNPVEWAADQQALASIQGSVADPGLWQNVVETADAQFGARPEVAVFSAAVFNVGTVLTLTEEAWSQHFDVNVTAVFRALKALLPSMIEQQRGSIVTVASVDAYMVEQGAAGYCSSKGALLQLTKSVAIDFARDGIRANCVAPGVIDTPFFRRHLASASDPEKFISVREQRNPLGRFLDASEVAASVEFVALDASGMTGSTITVDAGLSASFDFRTGNDGS